MSEPWFDGQTAGVVGAVGGCLGGLWGATVGCLSSWLIPRCKGRGLLLGLLWLGVALGVATLAVAGWALAEGQPYHVWYPFALPGVMLTLMGGIFIGVTRNRYRAAEEKRMAQRDFGG